MELVTLDSNTASTNRFQPVRLIENYDSLIWTERYWAAGDFELISSDVRAAMSLLPLESYVSLRESTVLMIVESHKIEKPKGKHARVIIRGRSFESVLERRAAVSTAPDNLTPPRSAWNVSAGKVSDAAYKAMRVVLGDIARSDLPLVNPMIAADAIPEINLPLPTDYAVSTATPFEVKAGTLYSTVLQMLEVNRHGIKAVRPAPGKTTVDLQIYNGADLRATAIFDARYDQFDSATYLLSYQGSANVAYIYGPNGTSVKQKNTAPAPTGLNRRVLLVDEMSDQALNSDANRQNRGLVELYKNNSIALFDGEVTELVTRYNKPIAQGGYGLGDIVTFNGDYGLTKPMRVSEFIRSSDANGEKAYPTFQTIDE